MSIDDFNWMRGQEEEPEWKRLIEETLALIRQEGSGQLAPSVDEVIRQMREEWDEQIVGNLR